MCKMFFFQVGLFSASVPFFQKALSCVLRRCVLFGEAFCALVGGCAASIGWKFFGIECFVFGVGSVWGGDGGFNCLLPHLLFCVV